jgi:hypothetical protein
MVPFWYRSILWEKCVIGVKMYVGCRQCVKDLWVMCNGTYVWAHVIQLPVYAWVSCSSHRGMYWEAVFIMDVGLLTRWSPPSFGLHNFSLWHLVCEGTICMWLWCPILICVYSEEQTVKFLLGILSHSGHCVTTGGIIIIIKKLCTNYHTLRVNVKQCGNALLDLFSYYTRTKACVGGMGCVTSQGAWVGGVVLRNGGVFRRTLKILFRNMVWLSFRWCTLRIHGVSQVC